MEDWTNIPRAGWDENTPIRMMSRGIWNVGRVVGGLANPNERVQEELRLANYVDKVIKRHAPLEVKKWELIDFLGRMKELVHKDCFDLKGAGQEYIRALEAYKEEWEDHERLLQEAKEGSIDDEDIEEGLGYDLPSLYRHFRVLLTSGLFEYTNGTYKVADLGEEIAAWFINNKST